MKLAVMSDLHFEFHQDQGRAFVDNLDPTGVDALVLAGDIGNSFTIVSGLRMLCEKYPEVEVLLVLGNHEFYGSDPTSTKGDVLEVASDCPNLHVLDNRTVEVGGVCFAGTTLWFRDDPMNVFHAKQLSDFSQIDGFVPWVYNENRLAESFLWGVMAMPRPPAVIITHHLPSARCVAPQYKGNPINRFFVAPIADQMPVLPKLWIYGHTHAPFDETFDGCRFLANPLGYPHEPNRGFKEKLIIEVEPTPYSVEEG